MNGFLAVIGAATFLIAGYYFVSWEKGAMKVPDGANGMKIQAPGSQKKEETKELANKQEKQVTQPQNNAMQQEVPTDLVIEKLADGTGDRMTKSGDTIAVHYTGTLLDGTKFDSSVDRGKPFEFQLGAGMVIAGWDQGLLDMKVGEKRKLVIPASLGYGSRAIGSIPADSTLVFETELIDIK